ncbi:Uncharacterized protein OS=Cystobacter fuscus DSM 2262 GN=D187_004469 PE=4 SV=1 [Tuwongella immobilis]|uniref:Uncharacterized protein n=2 Tax=Tuwongella immobilis TaxID=692036 RepID=A0A6C2YKW6_9BACT|nr:Uncharacterized protein OS=Cystobacter fuscus DSM 2262 GN=D187_004469 PE=4 SV=1 [Tuwongella immobilis]VTS00747.1 Uncharacterized protein OS=Cystobacter fuscus DSM 2262 GN=D187_004469 PE=4 SV=1 [Tuwongella immobilis]
MDLNGLILSHQTLRWIILGFGIATIYRTWRGWIAGRTWESRDTLTMLGFTSALNLQMLMGVMIYLNSPLTRMNLATWSLPTSGAELVFFGWIHPVGMLIGGLSAQAIASVTKRMESSTAKFRLTAIGMTVVMLGILALVPWPGLAHGRSLWPRAL